MPYYYNGTLLPFGQGFTIDDIQYPSSVLELWSREELEEVGVVWVDPPLPTLEEMKAAACAQVRDRRWRSHIEVTVGGVTFAADDTAATRLTAAITARQAAQALPWRRWTPRRAGKPKTGPWSR